MLRQFIFILLIFTLGAPLASAQQRKLRLPERLKDAPYTHLGTGLLMWQEGIDATNSGAKEVMEMQFIGVKLGLTLNNPRPKSRWRTTYAGDAGLGTTKGATSADSLNRQIWLMVSGSAGLVYRTSPYTEVGVYAPAVARYINWDLRQGSGLKMDREFSFSVGVGGVYTQRFSAIHSLNLTVAHQHMWDSTVWGISWEQRLR